MVIAVDIDAAKLERVKSHGAAAVVNVAGLDCARGQGRRQAGGQGAQAPQPHVEGASRCRARRRARPLAYELLTFGGTVGFIGFSMDKVSVRLGNFMAFDATAFGNWGCLPELYPAAVELVVSGKIQTRPFTKRFPLDEINAVIAAARAHEITERPVLVP